MCVGGSFQRAYDLLVVGMGDLMLRKGLCSENE